jgi:hypothetical protein
MNAIGIIFVKIADGIRSMSDIIFGINYEFFNSGRVANFSLVPVKVKK